MTPTLSFKIRDQFDFFLKYEPETERFQNSSARRREQKWTHAFFFFFFLQCSVSLCASSKTYFLINRKGNLGLLYIQITSFTVAIATFGCH